MASCPPHGVDEKKPHDLLNDPERGSLDSAPKIGDILQQEHTDPVLNAKMHLVNDVLQFLGTPIQRSATN